MSNVPLPIRSCIVTYMGDGRGLHYMLGVAAGTALIEQPPGSQLDLYTADQMRSYAADEIERLRAEVAGLREDAERYRHMRNNSQFQSRNGPGLYWFLPRYGQGDEGEQLDAAIDAARKGTTPTTPPPSPSPRS